MTPPTDVLADSISDLGRSVRNVDIQISFDVVKLLSEQLYASPVKAVEELVVNGWDAGASNCSVLVDVDGDELIAVFDDGIGMNIEQLSDLWHIGVSKKAPLANPRKQIGKFGIGKLASYAVAERATYVTKSESEVLAVTINFEDLATRTNPSTGETTPLTLDIRRIELDDLREIDQFSAASRVLAVADEQMDLAALPSWTVVVLERLRPRSKALATPRRLQWVLRTAMPRATDFNLHLNGARVTSAKDDIDRVAEFSVHELDPKRVESLNRSGEDWVLDGDALTSSKFPNGVRGSVLVTEKSLFQAGGKSEDLGRSHGFFVRVHGRLVNETDPLFGARPLSFSTWYKFAADVEADDLNQYITAARDDLEQSELKPALRALLIELFNQAREKVEALDKEERDQQRNRTETQREYVSRRIVEQPLADALVIGSSTEAGHQVNWSLVEPVTDRDDLSDLVAALYSDVGPRRSYTYRFSALGANEPYVRLDPRTSTVTLNEDHPLVVEFAEDSNGRRLLELVGTAEALLEAYMREADVAPEDIRELLARRDLLLRGLAQDESQSLKSLAAAVRDSARASDDSKALEIAVVGALRALGFAAQHVSGSGTPDGVADYAVYGTNAQMITLETKASRGTPSLGAIDVAGLESHAKAVNAAGTIVVAPDYPGIAEPDSEINLRAQNAHVSMWTAEQLAAVVEAAEARHINAEQVQSIITTSYKTVDVALRVSELLEAQPFSKQDLYGAVIRALEQLEGKVRDTARDVGMIAAVLSGYPGLEDVEGKDVAAAARELASSSRGILHFTEDEELVVLGDLEELKRRVSSLTGEDAMPRRHGTFRDRR